MTLCEIKLAPKYESTTYRAKNEHGNWVYGQYLYKPSDTCIDPNNEKHLIVNMHMLDWGLTSRDEYEVDGTTVCRCTGVQDFFKELVYDRHILRVEDILIPMAVIWDQSALEWDLYGLAGTDANEGNYQKWCTFAEVLKSNSRFRVVGDLYDTPERMAGRYNLNRRAFDQEHGGNRR